MNGTTLKPNPGIYKSVLPFRSGGSTSEGPPTARVGGFWAVPNLGLSYLLAARHVIEKGVVESRLNDVALPVAYLQRHAFEVALKNVLETAYMLQAEEAWLQLLQADAKAKRPTRTKVPLEHDFGKLLRLVGTALADINCGSVPPELEAMAKRLGEVEVFEPTRLRYANLRTGAPSFPDEVLLRVGETQEQLEAIFEKIFVYNDAEGSEENLTTSLAHEGMALDQAILRIVPIDEL
jgi:hypothetical protein